MILRKPYAFLIKNFKLIHIVLTVLLIFLAYKFNALQGFYAALVKNGTYTYIADMPSHYISGLMYLALIAVIVFSIIILYLLKHKEKPVKFYFLMVGFYAVLFFASFFLYNNLTIIEIGDYTFRTIQILRDVLQIVVFVQYGIIIFCLTRATGFDIRKFNFSEDLEELEIQEADREEIEVAVEIDKVDVKTKVKRFFRHTKYFVVEHQFAMTIILVIVVLVGSVTFYYQHEVLNKTYNELDKYMAGSFMVQPMSSMDTIYNSIGEDIGGGNSFYTVVQVRITNKSNVSKSLGISNMRLKIGSKVFPPVVSKYSSFDDLAEGYNNQVLESGESRIFSLVFELDNRYQNATKTFECFYGGEYKGNELIMNYHKTILKPKNVKSMERVTISKDSAIDFQGTNLGNMVLQFVNYEFANRFTYQYQSCINNDCHTYDNVINTSPVLYNTILMKLDYRTENVGNGLLNFSNSFLAKHLQVQYYKNGKEVVTKITNKLPNYSENTLYLEVPLEVSTSDEVHLLVKIRNKVYDYNLK